MAMNTKEHEDLETWARTFGGTAILGFISTLLLSGKLVHHVLSMRGLVFGYFIIPPSIISGILGLVWFSIIEMFDPMMTSDLRAGLDALKGNLINFVFAALILGITCSRKNSQHNSSIRGMLTSILHEGMPMILYSQILTWGQSTCCLLVTCLLNTFTSENILYVFPALVPLGLEAGNDVVLSSSQKTELSTVIVEEAESLGLVIVSVLGILLFTFKPYLISKGYLGKSYIREQMSVTGTHHSSTGQAEAFQRGSTKANQNLSCTGWAQEDIADDMPPIDKDDQSKYTHAGLGAHIALIALTAFMSFSVALILHLVEIELGIEYHWLSGVRMFKLAMCSAMISMQVMTARTKVKFNRDWFLRMCGLMLDLLLIASLAKAYPKPASMGPTHYMTCTFFVLICLAWNILCIIFVARKLFPNYWYERATTLTGDCLGHSYTGLLFIRTLDPQMESPVPAAYAYKLLLFFIPSSGAKQTIITNTLATYGPWVAFLICLCVMSTWLFIFDTYFRHRFVAIKKESSRNSLLDYEDSSESAFLQSEDGSQQLLLSDSYETAATVNSTASAGLSSSNIAQSRKTLRRSAHGNISSSDFNLIINNIPPSELLLEGNEMSDKSEQQQLQQLVAAQKGGAILVPSIRSNHPSTNNLSAATLMNIQASEASSIINHQQMCIIASFLSDSHSVKSWKLTYSLRQHGANLSTVLATNTKKLRTGGGGMFQHSPCIIIIEDSWGYIFGGFISPGMQNKSAYYGNGESFVFSVEPVPQAFKWTGKNELFVLSNEHCFAMGGGGNGFAIQLDDELDTGVSNISDTFNNQILSSSEFFKCLNVEVWTLDMTGYSV